MLLQMLELLEVRASLHCWKPTVFLWSSPRQSSVYYCIKTQTVSCMIIRAFFFSAIGLLRLSRIGLFFPSFTKFVTMLRSIHCLWSALFKLFKDCSPENVCWTGCDKPQALEKIISFNCWKVRKAALLIYFIFHESRPKRFVFCCCRWPQTCDCCLSLLDVSIIRPWSSTNAYEIHN